MIPCSTGQLARFLQRVLTDTFIPDYVKSAVSSYRNVTIMSIHFYYSNIFIALKIQFYDAGFINIV